MDNVKNWTGRTLEQTLKPSTAGREPRRATVNDQPTLTSRTAREKEGDRRRGRERGRERISHYHGLRGSTEFCQDLRRQKTRVPGISCRVVCVIIRLAVSVEHRLVTDGQTDRHTHRQTHDYGIYRANVTSRLSRC